MSISYHAEGVSIPPIPKRKINAWIKTISKKFQKEIGEITYIFCSDEKILEINQEYLQHDYFTDIITFDYSEGDKIAGDIFISLDTVKSNSEHYQTEYMNELYRIISHGILHLCGVNDKGPGEREIMENEENNALSILSEMLKSKI